MRRTDSQCDRRADEHDRLTQYQRRIQPAVWTPIMVLTHFIRTESDSSTGDFEFGSESELMFKTLEYKTNVIDIVSLIHITDWL